MSTFDNGNAVWFLMRGSGVVSLLLLTTVTALGIATRGGVRLGSLPRFATLALHRSISLLSVVFIAVHVTAAVIDPYAVVRLVDVFVPFGAGSKPLYVGLGAIAVDLMLALVVTGLLRERIGHRLWKGIHWAGYAMWPVAFVHAIGMGTDTSTVWLRGLAIASLAVVAGSVVWRLLRADGPPASAVAAR